MVSSSIKWPIHVQKKKATNGCSHSSAFLYFMSQMTEDKREKETGLASN